MKPRPYDPAHLDVEAFAADAANQRGEWPVGTHPRLAALRARDQPERQITRQVDRERRAGPGGMLQTGLRLRVQTTLDLACQRCLEPVAVPLDLDRSIRFVADERTAEALDAEIDDDVLVSSRALDLRLLVEDELLLALPLVPRHATCPQAVPLQHGEPELRAAHPFAALATLSKPSATGGDAGKRARMAAMLQFSAFPAAGCAAVSVATWARASKEIPRHGCPAEQEVAIEARHAPRAQRPRDARYRDRADDGRDASPAPHQPDRLLSRSQGVENEVGRLTAPTDEVGHLTPRPRESGRLTTPGGERGRARAPTVLRTAAAGRPAPGARRAIATAA
jgi:uncharacterized protein